tara:strand:- start:795 stop:1493 length:699 start_codon:yes stop_codon:yes gene_type:complete
MQLISSDGGLGTIQLTDAELVLMQKFMRFTSSENLINNQGKESFLEEFAQMMKNLFPSLPPENRNGYCINRDGHVVFERLADYSDTRSVVVDFSTTTGYSGGKLLLICPGETPDQYLMTVRTGRDRLGVVDDLVDVLGSSLNPVLVGIKPHPKLPSPNRPQEYGIADVPRIGEVREMYLRAHHLLDNITDITGVTGRDMVVLRRDALGLENVALREISATHYAGILQQLAER